MCHYPFQQARKSDHVRVSACACALVMKKYRHNRGHRVRGGEGREITEMKESRDPDRSYGIFNREK